MLRDDKKLAPAKPERALFLDRGFLAAATFALISRSAELGLQIRG